MNEDKKPLTFKEWKDLAGKLHGMNQNEVVINGTTYIHQRIPISEGHQKELDEMNQKMAKASGDPEYRKTLKEEWLEEKGWYDSLDLMKREAARGL